MTYRDHIYGFAFLLHLPLCEPHLKRRLRPYTKDLLKMPLFHAFTQFEVKVPQYHCEDESHLVKGQVSTNAITRTEGERLVHFTPVVVKW